MDYFQVGFIGRERGSIGEFSKRTCVVKAKSICRTHIIEALGDDFEVNAITLRYNITQGQEISNLELAKLLTAKG